MGFAKRGVLPFYRFTGKMAKHVCSCHGTQCFQKNSRNSAGAGGREGGREGEKKEKSVGGGKKKKKTESGGHMSPLLLRALDIVGPAFVLNIDAEAENNPCPNTGAGWQGGEDGPQTRLSPPTSSSRSSLDPSRAKTRP